MKSLCVTALYDIGRETHDGRKMDDYLNWFQNGVLRLKTPLVVYGEAWLKQSVLDCRKDYQTWFIEQPLGNIPYYRYREQVSRIIKGKEFRDRVSQPNRLECNIPEYSLVIYSKLHWLIDACSRYGNEDTQVFWIDAGCGRFFSPEIYDNEFPNPQKVDFLREKFFLEVRGHYPQLLSATTLPEDYFWLAKPFVAAGFMGGRINTVRNIATKVNQIFENLMLGCGVVATEENALGYLLKTNPDLFVCHMNKSNHPLESVLMMR